MRLHVLKSAWKTIKIDLGKNKGSEEMQHRDSPQWLVIAVAIYTSITMFRSAAKTE